MTDETKRRSRLSWIISIVLVLGVAATAAATRGQWLPAAQQALGIRATAKSSEDHSHDDGHSHGGGHSHGNSHSHGAEDDGHSHGKSEGHQHGDGETHSHAGGSQHSHAKGGHTADSHNHQEAENSLELSQVAWKNIGLKTQVVAPTSYQKTVAAPAVVSERPGRSQVKVAAPLTGIVTRVFPIEGEAIDPGQPMFELRLTHEDLVTAQREFLKSAQELDVVKREIARLKSLGDGVVPGRRILEHEYEQEKIEAAIHAQRQGLILHGLEEQQIESILQERKLLPHLIVRAPDFDIDSDDHGLDHIFHVQSIPVKRGQAVSAGEALAVLADHCVLYVEGQAFESDAEHLLEAARRARKLSLSTVSQGEVVEPTRIELPILYIADHFEIESRTQTFYLQLPNELIRNEVKEDHRFLTWRFRPGQRLSIDIPIGEPLEEQIVLPSEAVVDEGAESYVFVQARDHFDRVPVQVLFRDRGVIVLAKDDQLVGKRVAVSGAYQMHLAIKNQASGGAAAHGHTH